MPLSQYYALKYWSINARIDQFVFPCVLQGARGNDGAAGAAGPPVSFQFLNPKLSYW